MKDTLFYLVQSSKYIEGKDWTNEVNRNKDACASNAISILNASKYALSGLDFSNIYIPYANLNNAQLEYTNLSNADMRYI